MATRKNGWTPLQIAAHVGAFVPLLLIGWNFWQGNMALLVNPFQDVTLRTGKAALILLLLSLACTPLNTVFGWRQVLPLRKPLGLYAFMYGALHFLIFVVDNGYIDSSIDLAAVYAATFEKRFALVGFAALLILLPLALTSNQWGMRQLKKNWKRLHQLVYLVGILVIVHFVWLVKATSENRCCTARCWRYCWRCACRRCGVGSAVCALVKRISCTQPLTIPELGYVAVA